MKQDFRNNKFFWSVSLTILSFALLLILGSCEDDITPSLYDTVGPPGSTPVIESVNPPDAALAGVTRIVINGQNFSSVPENNFVYFDAAKANVLEASATQLTVTAPNIVKDEVNLKIAVFKVELFSNIVKYQLKSAVSELFEFKETDLPVGITTDLAGDVYVSLAQFGTGKGVKKIKDGVLVDYAPKGAEVIWSALKYGPDNIIYGAKQLRGIWQIPEGQAATNAPWRVFPTGVKIYDLDFDVNKNIWAVGDNENIFYAPGDGSDPVPFPFKANLRSVRYFENYIYVAGGKDGVQGVWRFEMLAPDNIGPAELYYDLTADYPGVLTRINAITFAEDGDLYVGTNLTEVILIVHPDKTVEPLYPGTLTRNALLFAWGPDTFLYYLREAEDGNTQTIIKLDMQKSGAPHYGRD